MMQSHTLQLLLQPVPCALEIGIPLKNINNTIQQFRGLQGRMQEMVEGGINVLIIPTPAWISSQRKSTDLSLRRKRNVIMVLGEEAAQVCEGLPPEDVADLDRPQAGRYG